MTKLYFLLLTFLFSSAIIAQDTISVYFESNSFELSIQAKRTLNKSFSDGTEIKSAMIIGHTDSEGFDETNLVLASNRTSSGI